MDVTELREQKERLEDRISEFVTKELREFEEETGLKVHNVHLSLNQIRADNVETEFLTLVSTTIFLNI